MSRPLRPGYEFLLCHKFNGGSELGKRSVQIVLSLVKGMIGGASCQVSESACRLNFLREFIGCLVTASGKVRDPLSMWDCRFCRIRWRALASASDRGFAHSGQLREWQVGAD